MASIYISLNLDCFFLGCPGAKGGGPTSLALLVVQVVAVEHGKRRDHPERHLPLWRSALPVPRRVKVASD